MWIHLSIGEYSIVALSRSSFGQGTFPLCYNRFAAKVDVDKVTYVVYPIALLPNNNLRLHQKIIFNSYDPNFAKAVINKIDFKI